MRSTSFGTQTDVRSVFRDLATRIGDSEAILAPEREPLTYSKLESQIAAVKESLNSRGIGRGDRVVVVLPNGPEIAVSFLAITACAIFVPLNPAYTEDEFRRYLSRLKPKAVIVPSASATSMRGAAKSLSVMTLELGVDPTSPAGCFELAGGTPSSCGDASWNTADDVGLILHTSGTTARQKLVPVRQRHYLAYARAMRDFFRLDSSDRCFALNPMFHGSGIRGSLLVPLVNGSSVVCLPKTDVSSFYRYLELYRPTWYVAAYTIQNAILEESASHRSAIERSCLRFIRCSSGWLDPRIQEGLERTFRAPVIQQYSASETGAITCNPLPPAERKNGSAGVPVVNEVKILGSDGSFLSTGEEGEIVVRGPSVFDGYLDDPEANEAAFVDGWYRTGDLGRFDADGFLTISGRVKDVINRGGEKIAPTEVEAVLSEHTAVQQVRVIGVSHPSLGEEVVAAVVLRRGAAVDETELARFAREKLSDFKVPRRIFFFAAFPLTSTAKVDTKALVRACEERRRSPSSDVAATSLERKLTLLWQRVLGCDRIGPNDDFFLAGGDSLKAEEMLLQVSTELGFDLPGDAVYGDASTIAGMADLLSTDPVDSPTAAHPQRPRVNLDDLVTIATFLGLAPVAWLLPRRTWTSIAKTVARAHITIRRSRARRLQAALPHLETPVTAETIELDFLTGLYRDIMLTLREHVPWRGRLEPAFRGGEHLAAGRGAVLWSASATFSGLMSKKALKAAGVPLVSLRSAVHPYSGTRLGMRVLNPVRTRIENRYLAGSVSLVAGRGSRALRELRAHLDEGRLVVIAANGAEGEPLKMPFLGGTLKLALGAPTLALLHGVPLLPLFTVPDDDGGFEVVIRPAIHVPSGGALRDRAEEMARRYAELLEGYVRKHPSVWRGWFAQNTWEPSEDPAVVETSVQ